MLKIKIFRVGENGQSKLQKRANRWLKKRPHVKVAKMQFGTRGYYSEDLEKDAEEDILILLYVLQNPQKKSSRGSVISGR